MNMQEYVDVKVKHTINEKSWDALWRKLAFIEFDAALEEYVENGKERDNGGRSLMDIPLYEVEQIMTSYLGRVLDQFRNISVEEMRNAIQDVTGLVC